MAVTSVLVHHCVQMSPITTPWIRATADYGQYSVDLFFVLSGWLIGGLYWRERKTFGNVMIWRFWTRRWMRTMPPYFAALLASYLGVYMLKAEAFDYGYLLFAQNYYHELPFFVVSWSLCIEEHFYLFAPLILLLWLSVIPARHKLLLLVVMLYIASPAFRLLEYQDAAQAFAFGYSQTATHLRLEGLVAGFAASYLYTERPEDFRILSRASPWVFALSAASLLLLKLSGGRMEYIFWNAMLALCQCAMLVFLVSANEIDQKLWRFVMYPMAVTSYSIYLTHVLALHTTVELVTRLPVKTSISYFPISLTLIAAYSALFYFAVERGSIRVREFFWPRRAASAEAYAG